MGERSALAPGEQAGSPTDVEHLAGAAEDDRDDVGVAGQPADVARIEELLAQRDGWIEHYQRGEVSTSGKIADLNSRLQEDPLNRLISAGRKAMDRFGLTARREK